MYTEVIISILALLASFYLMARIVDEYFIDSLDKIARKMNMSSDAAGATLMAMGSSAPELFIAIISIIKGFLEPGQANETIGIGTIVGSAIFNVLVIVGAAAVARKALLAWKPVLRDMVAYSIAIGLLLWAFSDFQVSMLEAGIFVGAYVIYVLFVMNWRKLVPEAELPYDDDEEDEPEDYSGWRRVLKLLDKLVDALFPKPEAYWGVFTASIIYIAGLSWVLVESAVILSDAAHVPKSIVGLTVLAIGTSIPDLMSSVIVAKQGRGGMAISNSIGSNIFDILIGLGLPWLITILITGGFVHVAAQNLFTSAIILFGSVILVLMLFLIRKWKVDAISGWIFILLYMGYLVWEILQIIP